MLTACAQDAGVVVYRVGAVPDDPHSVMEALTDQLVHADAIITTGGVSAGAYDTVKEVLSRLGTVQFDKVAMQPGMPQGFGTIGESPTPIFTLPGNPVSSFVSFEIFVRPALRKMAGQLGLSWPYGKGVKAVEDHMDRNRDHDALTWPNWPSPARP